MDDAELDALMGDGASYDALYGAAVASTVDDDDDDDDLFGATSAVDTTPTTPPPPPTVVERSEKRSKKKKKGKKGKRKRKRERRRQKRLVREDDDDDDDDAAAESTHRRKRPSARALKRARLLEEAEPGGGYEAVDPDDEWPTIDPVAPASSPDEAEDGDESDVTLDDLLSMGTASAISAASAAPRKHKRKKSKSRRRRVLHDDDDDDDDDAVGGGGTSGSGSGDSDDAADTAVVSGANGEEEEPSASNASESRTMDVRAISLVSIRPPVVLFRVGRKRTSQLTATLVGDLVRDISCPLHLFRVRVRPETASENYAGALEVLDVERVLDGPAVVAEKEAQRHAEFTNSSAVAADVPQVCVSQLKTAIAKSGYFRAESLPSAHRKDGKARTAYIGACLAGLLRAADGMVRAPLTEAALESVAPADGDSQLSWACRNALGTRKFFDCANLVGGSAARSIGVTDNGNPSWAHEWEILRGAGLDDAGDDDDDAAADGGGGGDEAAEDAGDADAAVPQRIVLTDYTVRRALERVHFFSKLGEYRMKRLNANLDVSHTEQRRSIAECVVDASRIYHRLPRVGGGGRGGGDDEAFREVAWGRVGDVWPEPVQRILQGHGLAVACNATGRWYACRKEAGEFYARIADSAAGHAYFVHAETDDDDANPDGGYISRLRDVADEHGKNLLIVTRGQRRARYLESQVGKTSGTAVAQMAWCGDRTIRPGDIVWIDRAHLASSRELSAAMHSFAIADRIYIAGSLWVGVGGGPQPTLFGSLYGDAPSAHREVLSGTLEAHKAAPTMAGATPRRVMDAVLRDPAGIVIVKLGTDDNVPGDVTSAIPHARVLTVRELAVGDYGVRSAIVLFSEKWARGDLTTVWQSTQNRDACIWFIGSGGDGGDWRAAMRRSSGGGSGAQPSEIVRAAGGEGGVGRVDM